MQKATAENQRLGLSAKRIETKPVRSCEAQNERPGDARGGLANPPPKDPDLIPKSRSVIPQWRQQRYGRQLAGDWRD